MQKNGKDDIIRPASALSKFTLEANKINRGMSIFVGGIVGINDFSEESILLKSHGCRVKIVGKRLSLKIYENSSVEVNGRVESINFAYGKN